jgi:hypothetical protein
VDAQALNGEALFRVKRGIVPRDWLKRATSFTLFRDLLPPEIRSRVWPHAISVPRIVEVKFDEYLRCTSKTPPPLLAIGNLE